MRSTKSPNGRKRDNVIENNENPLSNPDFQTTLNSLHSNQPVTKNMCCTTKISESNFILFRLRRTFSTRNKHQDKVIEQETVTMIKM